MFKRREKQGFWRKMREAAWPSMGWLRTADYYRHRVFRGGDSIGKIAGGLALGACLSFSPFIGFHIAQAMFLAFLLRLNVVAALVGTAFANPWTYPFLYLGAYKLGVLACNLFGHGHFVTMPPDLVPGGDPAAFFHYMFAHPMKLLLPLTVGGYIAALLSWPVAYAVLYYPVLLMHEAYKKNRKRRK